MELSPISLFDTSSHLEGLGEKALMKPGGRAKTGLRGMRLLLFEDEDIGMVGDKGVAVTEKQKTESHSF